MTGVQLTNKPELVDEESTIDTTDPKKPTGVRIDSVFNESTQPPQISRNIFASREHEDISQDPTKFDFQLKVGADNEEIRAKRQTGWQLARNSGAQILAMGVGGMISGFGYMGDLFTNIPNLIRGDEVEFNNILTQMGEGLQEWTQDFAPIHQTRKAQEGGWRAMGDATWWAGNAPTLASSFAIMVPTYAASRAVGALARTVGRRISGAAAGTKAAERLSPAFAKIANSRRARGTIDHLGTSVLSRHVYNSLEANDVYQQEYQESLQKGLSEEEAKKRAGQAAAFMYRIGYGNIWKDALQWGMILGRPFGRGASRRNWYTNASKNANTKRVVDDLQRRFGDRIPREAFRRVGLAGQRGMDALRTTAKMGLLEGFEEINIQHQKMLARDYINDLTGNIGEPGTGWRDIYGTMAPKYLASLGEFIYDEDSLISPEAFDAAFWAFGSGMAMGGVMKVAQPRIDNALGSGEATRYAKDLATFKYFQSQMGGLKVAQMQNNAPLEQEIYDKAFFGMTIGGLQDGNTHVEGALSGERIGDQIASLEEIVKADDATLDNSGLPSTPEMRQTYERMLSDTYYIAERFDKHFNETANLSADEGRALSTTITYHEYMKKRLGERLSDFQTQKADLESQIDMEILQPEYQTILPLRLQQEGHKRSIEQLNEYIAEAKKAEPENTTDEAHKQNQIEFYEARKEAIQERIKDYQDQIDSALEGVEPNQKQKEVVDNLVSNQMELIDVNEFIGDHQAHIDVINSTLEDLYTPAGQKKYLNERKRNISKNRNAHKQAEILQATTKQQLEDVGEQIDTYTNETKQIYRDQTDKITERDRAASKVEAPQIDQEHIDRVDERVPTMTPQKFVEFKEQIEQQDIHGNTKNKILEYADKVYEASRGAVADVQNRIEIRKLKEQLKKEHGNLIDRVFAENSLNNAMNVINKADVSGEVKRDITEVAKEYYNRLDNKIPPTQKEEINTDKDAKSKREGKDVEEVETTFTQDEVFPFEEIQDLAKKISEGKEATTPEELQLQANYPEALELELNKLQEGDKDLYRGIEVKEVNNLTTSTGVPGAASYNRKNNVIKVNRDLLKDKFKEKAWTNPRELKDGSFVQALPESQFRTYEQWESFVLEHEYQHSLYSYLDFKNDRGQERTLGEYETEINNRALTELNIPEDTTGETINPETGKPFTDVNFPLKVTDNIVYGKPTVESMKEMFTLNELWSLKDRVGFGKAKISILNQAFNEKLAEITQNQQQPEVEETTESITLPLAKDQYGQNAQGKWELAFKFEDGELSIINRGKEYSHRSKLVDFEQMANPAIKQGDSVTLELLEGDEIGIVHEAHDKPIGVIRKPELENYTGDKKLAIQKELAERAKIVSALKEGKNVTATISQKIVSDANINNIKFNGQTFVRDVETIESNQFTKKEDGSIVQEDRPVILVTSEGIPQNADAKLSLNTDFYPFLDQSIKEEINTQIANVALSNQDQYFGGHIWIVQLDPYGTWKALKMVTRRLDKNAVNKASELLLKGEINDADHIVNISSNLHRDTDTNLYLNAHVLNAEENTFRIDYFDPNLGEVVRLAHNVNEAGFQAFRLNKDQPRIKQDEKGFESFQFQSTPSDVNYQDGLKKLLATKRYNVLRDKMGDTTTPYTSPLTGKTHKSYYDYLTKDNVWKGEEEFQGDGNNILATDLYSENGSFFSNIGMRVSTDISQPSTPQKKSEPEYTQPEQIDDSAVDNFDFMDDFTEATQFESERDKAISEAYNKHKDTFKEGNKFVTLEDFSQEIFFNQLTSPEKIMKYADSIAEKIKNKC